MRGYGDYDLIIVGAGPVGCVIADRAASELAWKCLVLEKRSHIAGNCYDFIDENGLLLHRYGPHCFRTWDEALVRYLANFTEWIPGNHRVMASHQGRLYPFPINLTTLEQFFDCRLTEQEGLRLIEGKRMDIPCPANSEEYVLSRVGRELYEAFYLGYTRKQWGLHPRELLPSVCGRVPIRFNRDVRYADETFQLMPKSGYTAMFRRMLSNPLIEVRLDCDFFAEKEWYQSRKALIYTGPVDAYFDYCYGALPWRSLEFAWVPSDMEYEQPCMAINYSTDFAFTRSVEIKHITGQKHPRSMLSLEYPRADGDPYYPVPTEANLARYARYGKLAEEETIKKAVYFCGRLATYRYLNIDQAILEALKLYQEIKERKSSGDAMDRMPCL